MKRPPSLSVLLPVLFPADLHVPGTYASIQAAVDAAQPGDAVVVAPGSYVENVDLSGKAIAVRSSDGPLVTELRAPAAAGSVAVTFHSGEGPATLLEGFSLSGSGSLDFAPPVAIQGASPTLHDLILTNGYGFAVTVADGSPTLLECEFHGGIGLESGVRLERSDADIGWCSFHDLGAVAVLVGEACSPVIHHCALHDCAQGVQVGWAQPAVADPGRTRVRHCTLARNYRDVPNGNSIWVWAGYSVVVTDNLFLDHPWSAFATMGNPLPGDEVRFERNRVFTSYEGAAQVQTYEIDRVVMRGNVIAADPVVVPTGYSCGIEVDYYDSAWIEGNTVAGFSRATQTVQAHPGALMVHEGGIYHDLGPWGDYIGVPPSYSAVPDLAHAGPGCLLVPDPSFVDRDVRDYHLRSISACIDVGPATGSRTDVDRDLRVAPFEMGADELPVRAHWVTGDPLSDGTLRFVAQGQPGERVILGWTEGTPTQAAGGPTSWRRLGTIGPDGLLVVPGLTVAPSRVPRRVRTWAIVGTTATTPRSLAVGG